MDLRTSAIRSLATLACKVPLLRKAAPVLPMSRAEMDTLGWDACDVVLVTGDAYVDHPSFGMAIIGRLLEAQGLSDRYRKADRRISNRRLATASTGRRVRATAEGIEADRLEVLVACTISWEGIGFDGGEKECTPENARAAYKKLPWLREQADAFIVDRANFLKA
jgi:hypothetical protein